MSNTRFIWDSFFKHLIKPEHPAVYQYIKGGIRSKESAIMRITEEVSQLCTPYWTNDYSIDIVDLRGVARQYLKHLETEWYNGNIIIQEIYHNGPYSI